MFWRLCWLAQGCPVSDTESIVAEQRLLRVGEQALPPEVLRLDGGCLCVDVCVNLCSLCSIGYRE